ncbi:hypothetical protein [Enterobacter hormaechei]|uniref:hypothetical protein n=1 Tax=Enterobacter hormaechei TaxID=158836 RepID=UPI0007961090|nr:hypothetical protein [Enterobacter hormaechei]CZY43672.1 Uncharacterised protein [Enterobacter hormaechei]CZY79313.1 Uncharacterised protein [Enterobacter hormaechei]CZY80234.1 Uncharacterised protein [Enterobacter hormaechei]SAF26900.1 Uncharacterised protein [Enterobacter hormaechei]
MFFNDESLFSFLYRTQLVYGYHNFRNLITLGGWVAYKIIARKELLPVYHRFNEFKLLNVVNSSEHPHTTFSSPYSNLKEFEEFTEHGTAYINGRPDRTIRFCNVCILESQKKYGVGYLKKDWEFSRYCFKHKLPLSEIIPCSYIKTVKAMSDIMQGVLPANDVLIISPLEKIKLREIKKQKIAPLSTLYIKPCASYLMKEWIYANRIILTELLQKKLYDLQKDVLLKQLTLYPDWFVSKLYHKRHVESLVIFKDYVAQNTCVIKEKYGVLRKDSFVFRCLKAKMINCNDCAEKLSPRDCKLQNKF